MSFAHDFSSLYVIDLDKFMFSDGQFVKFYVLVSLLADACFIGLFMSIFMLFTLDLERSKIN